MVWIAGLALAYACWRAALAWGLYRLDRRAVARGWPDNLAALDAYYQLPDGRENAAQEILAAGEALDDLQQSARRERVPRQDPLDGWFEKLEALMARHEAGEIEEDVFQRERQTLNEEMDAHLEKGKAQLEEMEKEHEALSAALAANDTQAFDEILKSEETPVDFLKDPIPSDSSALSEEWRAGMSFELAKHEHIMPRFERAAAIGAARFPIDFAKWSDSSSELMDAFAPLKTGAHLLDRTAVMHADAGREDEATYALEMLFRLAQSIENQPTVMSQLVWMSMISTAVTGMALVLGRCRLEGAHLARLDACLDRASAHDPFAVAFSGERCILRPSFKVRDARPEDMEKAIWEGMSKNIGGGEASDDEDLGLAPLDFPGEHGAGHWRLIYEIPYKLAGLESLDCLLFMSAVEACLDVAKFSYAQKANWWRKNNWASRQGPGFLLLNSRTIMAHPMSLLMSILLQDVRQANARTALAVERYRLERGALPGSLAELPGEVPTDIYSGAPLRYRRLDNGYVVYSVGFDGKDGGGEPGNWHQGGDITFHVVSNIGV